MPADSHEFLVSGSVTSTTSSIPAHLTPPAIVASGTAAQNAWDDFFTGAIRNPTLRAAYLSAICQFFCWLEAQRIPLERVTPGIIGRYMGAHPGSVPTRKLHLAALRAFFQLLVCRHICLLNPAAGERGERYSVVEGKMLEITVTQVRRLVACLRLRLRNGLPDVVALRDRAIIGTLFYTAARAGAVAKLRLKHLRWDGSQYTLSFEEKGNTSREVPVRADLQEWLMEYLQVAGTIDGDGELPLFCSARRKTHVLTMRPVKGAYICNMVRRRLADAGLPAHLSPHSFRVATITDLLSRGEPLESVRHYLAGHADPRTTRLYDPQQKNITRNLVERISNLTDDPS